MKHKSKEFLRKSLPFLIGVFIGAAGGYLYYRFVGCASGTCAITSNSYISTVYGAIIGGLLGSIFTTKECCTCTAGECEESHHYE